MELLGPALGGIQPTEEQHHTGRKLLLFLGIRGLAAANLFENLRGGLVGTGTGVTTGQPMIGKTGAHGMKKLMAQAKCIQEIAEKSDINVGSRCQTVHPWVEDIGGMHVERFVWTERRQHAR